MLTVAERRRGPQLVCAWGIAITYALCVDRVSELGYVDPAAVDFNTGPTELDALIPGSLSTMRHAVVMTAPEHLWGLLVVRAVLRATENTSGMIATSALPSTFAEVCLTV